MNELSGRTIGIVKATGPAMARHGEAINMRMYERLFRNPAIKGLFDQAAQRMAQRHVATHVRPEHYPEVRAALLGAVRDVLDTAVTDEILDAWGEAYDFLAQILIDREAELYRTEPALA